MALYRIVLRLTAPLGTPLASPTLFGRICWLVAEMRDEAALEEWLADDARCWTVSDGFPHGFLPRPLVRPRALAADQVRDAKERKKRPLVRRETWVKHRHRWDENALDLSELGREPRHERRIAHNHVHRSGRGTLEEGGLYFLDEDWRFAAGAEDPGTDPSLVDIYVQTAEPLEAVRDLIGQLGEDGYGRDAAIGRGRWVIEAADVDEELVSGDGERRMSLSRGIIEHQTMRDALWRLEPHFGRTGPQLSLAGKSPFKRPVLLTRPGMTFAPVGDGPWGRILSDIHPECPEIRLDARHIAIPFSEAPGDVS